MYLQIAEPKFRDYPPPVPQSSTAGANRIWGAFIEAKEPPWPATARTTPVKGNNSRNFSAPSALDLTGTHQGG
jgi:hypothetical protein